MPTAHLPDRSLIAVTGADAELLLQNVITCDLDSLPHGVARPGALLTPQGKILFDFLIWRGKEDGFFIDIRTDQSEAFIKRMMLYKLRSDMTLSPMNDKNVAVSFGEETRTAKQAIRDERFAGTIVTRSPVESGSKETTKSEWAAWDALRIENGVAEGGLDFLLGDAFPHDVSLDQNTGVDFKKGCYVGQEVVSRMQHRGTARRRVMIAHADKALPSAGTEVTAHGKTAAALGTVVDDRALMIGRLDRVHEATQSGAPLMAGDAAIASVKLPPHVSYAWPENEQEKDG